MFRIRLRYWCSSCGGDVFAVPLIKGRSPESVILEMIVDLEGAVFSEHKG